MAYDHVKIMKSVVDSEAWFKTSPSAKAVYICICNHYNWQERKSFPSYETIESEAGVSRRTVFDVIKELENNFLIVKKKFPNQSGRGHNYYLVPAFLEKEILDNLRKGKDSESAKSALQSAIRTFQNAPPRRALKVQKQHPNYMINYINITNSFNQPKQKSKEKPNIEQSNNFQEKLHLYNLKLGNNKKLSDEEIDNLLPQLNRDINFNEEEKESIKIGLRTGIIGRSC